MLSGLNRNLKYHIVEVYTIAVPSVTLLRRNCSDEGASRDDPHGACSLLFKRGMWNSLAYLRQFCSAFARLWAAGEGKAKTESDQAETINHLHLQIFF